MAAEGQASPARVDDAAASLPATERLYLEDTYRFTLPGARVLVVVTEQDPKGKGKDGGGGGPAERTAVVLDRTVFHPQGGGQPSDQGLILGGDGVAFAVELVRDNGQGVLHHYGAYVGESGVGGGFGVGDSVELKVDEAKRRLHARLHSAGHALDVAVARAGLGPHLRPTKGYHFDSGPYVEYEGELPAEDPVLGSPEALAAKLTALMAELVEEAAETEVHVLSKAKAGALLEAGGGTLELLAHLPEDKDVRVVAVAGGPCPCGGTHVKSTAELGRVEVTKVKATPKKRLVKVSYRLLPSAEASSSSRE